jgi:hypothetical protein
VLQLARSLSQPIRHRIEAFASLDDASPVVRRFRFLNRKTPDYRAMPETSSSIFAKLKSARRTDLKSQTAPSFSRFGRSEHIKTGEGVNAF